MSAAIIVAAYLIGSVPVAYLAGRATKGIDIRRYGSGNVGASNVWQSVSHALVVPVGLAQVLQGAAGVLLAKAAGEGAGVQGAAAVAAVVANDWNPWLRLDGGRGIGLAIGAMAVLSPAALATFIAVALAAVVLRAIPQGTALGLAGATAAAAIADAPAGAVAGIAAIWVAMMVKRLLGNGPPDAAYARPQVWLTRLVYDRDDPDREAWVRRNVEPAVRR